MTYWAGILFASIVGGTQHYRTVEKGRVSGCIICGTILIFTNFDGSFK
jgi:hypothetical protein